MLFRSRTAALALVSALGVGFADASSFHRYYFKDPIPLVVVPGQYAVSDPAPGQRLERSGSGWSRTPARSALPFAARPEGAFTTPIFRNPDGTVTFPTQDLIVGFDAGVSTPEARRRLELSTPGYVLESDFGGMRNVFLYRTLATTGEQSLRAAEALVRRSDVEFATPNMLATGHRHQTFPNDPLFSNQWGLHNNGQLSGSVVDRDMDAPEAWDFGFGANQLLVLIIDDGIQNNHPDLTLTMGTNTGTGGGQGTPVSPNDRHGTAVAGTIAAVANNAIGVAGIAPGTRLAAGRFINESFADGSFNYFFADFVEVLDYAQTIDAKVINMSIFVQPDATATQRMNQLYNGGRLLFASSGNTGAAGIVYPANLEVVNAVGALNFAGNRASFSTTGPQLDFAAPGDNIFTTDRTGSAGYVAGDYVWVLGTSFASPLAAGAAALIWSANPYLTNRQVEKIMRQTTDDVAPAGFDNGTGWGSVNAGRAVGFAASLRINGIVTMQGLGELPDSIPFVLTRSPGGQPIAEINVPLAADGSFSVLAPYEGFKLTTKPGTFLRRTLTLWNDNQINGLTLELINGDINDDNAVDLDDYFDLADAYRTDSEDSNWNPRADLDQSGFVDLDDYFILADSFRMTGDDL